MFRGHGPRGRGDGNRDTRTTQSGFVPITSLLLLGSFFWDVGAADSDSLFYRIREVCSLLGYQLLWVGLSQSLLLKLLHFAWILKDVLD